MILFSPPIFIGAAISPEYAIDIEGLSAYYVYLAYVRHLERVSIDRFLLRCYRSPKSDPIRYIFRQISLQKKKRQCRFIFFRSSLVVVAFYEHSFRIIESSP